MGSAQVYLGGLFDYMLSALASLPLVTVIGDPPDRLPVVSILVNGVAAEQVVQRLADNGILAVVNPTSRVLDALGVEEIGGALTLGLAHYSTMAEVDHLVRSLASLG
jgi:selenocysteine lyase/cysteine desulfurase